MALDHYIPQVHLRRFLSKEKGQRLNAIRKRDSAQFSPNTRDVCRIEQGSTNAYLQEPRAIEAFLETIEPHYNEAADGLRAGRLDESAIHVVAGFTAYVATCSPGGMRIHSAPLREVVEATAAIMDARGLLPPAPEVLGGAGISELLANGTVEIVVDRKYPQSIGISQIDSLTAMLERFDWEVLRLAAGEGPLLTSDYPAALGRGRIPGIPCRIVPLAPDLAVRIEPRLPGAHGEPKEALKLGGRRLRTIGRDEVVQLNRAIVRCAEELVFFGDGAPWAPRLVERNRHFRVEPVSTRIPRGRGTLLASTLTVAERVPSR